MIQYAEEVLTLEDPESVSLTFQRKSAVTVETKPESPVVLDEDGQGFTFDPDLLVVKMPFMFEFLGRRVFAVKEADETVNFYAPAE